MKNEKILLSIARDAIKEKLFNIKIIDKSFLLTKYPILNQNSAVFITINKDKNLRGCIGSLVAHRTLLDDIISNSVSAGFSDPRFKPLSKKEFENIEIEISILSEPQLLNYSDISDLRNKIRPNIDGVVLKYGNSRATYLPHVWEQLPQFDKFFEFLCKKAGLSLNCLNQHPDIYTYQAQKIKDK